MTNLIPWQYLANVGILAVIYFGVRELATPNMFWLILIGVLAITTLVLGVVLWKRRKAENRWREREASLTHAQRLAHLGSWDLDVIQQKFYWSDELYRILGWEARAFIPNPDILLQVIHPEDRQRAKIGIYRPLFEQYAIPRQWTQTVNLRIILPNGQQRILHATCEPIFNSEGAVTRIVGTLQDVTAQKQTELALKRSKTEYRELVETLEAKVSARTKELNQKNQALSQYLRTLQQTQQQLIQAEKMSSLGQLVAGIAHEINNPINFIYGNLPFINQYAADLLKLIELYQQEYSPPSPKIQAAIENIDLDFVCEDLPNILCSTKTGAVRIREIVQSLQSFSRLDQAELKAVDIHAGLESTLLLLENRLKSRGDFVGINVIKEYGNLPLVECYPSNLNQVFMNILTNAIDALAEVDSKVTNHKLPRCDREALLLTAGNLPEATINYQFPQICIRTAVINADWIQIDITDNGSGMSEVVLTHLFDPFFTTKPVGKGTGLGMSVSYQIIVEQHSGQMKCISQLGQGTTFKITLPIYQTKQKSMSILDSDNRD